MWQSSGWRKVLVNTSQEIPITAIVWFESQEGQVFSTE